MSYYHEIIFQVWFKSDSNTKAYLDEQFFETEKAKEYIDTITQEIKNNPNWGYDNTFSFEIVEIYNPQYDSEQIEIDELGDYLYHKNL